MQLLSIIHGLVFLRSVSSSLKCRSTKEWIIPICNWKGALSLSLKKNINLHGRCTKITYIAIYTFRKTSEADLLFFHPPIRNGSIFSTVQEKYLPRNDFRANSRLNFSQILWILLYTTWVMGFAPWWDRQLPPAVRPPCTPIYIYKPVSPPGIIKSAFLFSRPQFFNNPYRWLGSSCLFAGMTDCQHFLFN